MAEKRKPDLDRADEGPQQAVSRKAPARHEGAIFLGGEWRAADGSPLTDKEAQQAHRARDRELAAAREQAILGR